MLFSAQKWNGAAELNAYIPVSSALNFESLESSLRDAENLFLLPLFGENVMIRLEELYNSSDDLNPIQRLILDEARRAEANLAFWYNFNELNTRITDQGFQRQESSDGTFKSTYKYQELQLRSIFKNKGFNAIDRLLYLLESHMDLFPEFEQSPAYEERKTAIVRSTKEFNDSCFINESRIIFLRLKPVLKQVEETLFVSIVGQVFYDNFMAALANGDETIDGVSVEKLRLMICRIVCNLSAAVLIRSTGSLTDRGLYFLNVTEGDGMMTAKPADPDYIEKEADRYESLAKIYAAALSVFIRSNLPLYYTGSPNSSYDRDNSNKSTFFA